MNSFLPANLSPQPKEPLACEPCELPYGLTWDDLADILPGLDREDSSGAQAFVSHEKQGLNGGDNSCILQLKYPLGMGQVRTETVFAKCSADPQKLEAQKYQFIAGQGVAVPRLLAVFQKAETEVILLEFLATIGIDFSSQAEVEDLLHLVASLNAIQNPPGLFSPSAGMPEAEFDEFVRDALEKMGRNTTTPIVDGPGWFSAYKASQKIAQKMPLALNHNEFYFQQVGWAQRGSSRELVMFDLETMTLSQRFTDIASILYPLAVYTGREQAELFQIYLDRLQQLSQDRLDFSAAWRELKYLRITQSCYTLPWLVGENGRAEGRLGPDVLTLLVNCLREDMNDLGLL